MNVSLESFVYPVKGTIQLDVDVQSLKHGEWYSGIVKIGRARWYVKAHETWSRELQSYSLILSLGVIQILDGAHSMDCHITLTIRNKDPSRNYSFSTAVRAYTGYLVLCKELRHGDEIGITQLLKNGFVFNGKLKIECTVGVHSESLMRFATKNRPDDVDAAFMLANSVYKPIRKLIEMEFDVSELKKNPFFSQMFYIDGVPCQFEICHMKNSSLTARLHINSKDESEWWRVRAPVTFRIINQKNESMSFCESLGSTIYCSSHSSEEVSIGKNKLLDPKTGFLKFGRVTIEVFITIHDKYGFDEETGKGIDKPMRMMTDAVIKVEDEEFYVSRMILSHQSKWFCDLFSEQPEETNFNFSDIDAGVFNRLLKLICNIEMEWNDEDIIEILPVIEKYQAYDCFMKLDNQIQNINFENDMKMLELIDKYDLPNIKAIYIAKLKNYEELVKLFQHSEIGNLSTKLRRKLTSDEVAEQKNRDDEPFYVYSKKLEISCKTADPKEVLQKFLEENDEAKKLLEDPAIQNVGNSVLNFLAENKQSGLCQISFKEFSDPSDMVTFNFKDNKMFYSSKQILSDASKYFMKRYFGPDAKDDDNTIIVDEITSKDFNVLLNHVYHPALPITEKNLDILLPLAHRLTFFKVLEKCEKYLIKHEKMTVDVKECYAKNYRFEYLLSACNNFKKQ